MFKTILATAAATLIVGTVAAPAQADGSWWGKMPNGTSWNGVEMNGPGWFNGHSRQGVEMNGKLLNGRFSNGHIRNGKLLNGWKSNGAEQGVQAFVLEAIELPPQEH